MTTPRCLGQCCRYLDVGPPGALLSRIQRRLLTAPVDAADLGDLRKIRSMLVYRGHVVNPSPRTDDNAEPRHWHTCKHHDAASGDCTIYETRPEMCRAFPNGKPCPYVGCVFSEAPSTGTVVHAYDMT